MAVLKDLPAELLQHVGAMLMPQDAFAFAITSKHVWERCMTVIAEHQELSRRYNWTSSPWTDFEAMCNDPRIAYHVRTIGNIFQDDLNARRCNLTLDEVQRERCRAAAEESEAFMGIDPEEIVNAINSPCCSQLLCIMMQICPRVTTIRFVNDHDLVNAERIFKFLAKVARSPEELPPGTLADLKTASITHWDSRTNLGVRHLATLLQLPTLRTLTGTTVGPGRWNPIVQLPSSRLTTLKLTDSLIEFDQLVSILSQIRALETFVYSDGKSESAWAVEPGLCGVVAAAAEHQGHSLLHLEVTESSSSIGPYPLDPNPFPGFRGFSKLQYLKAELDLFCIANLMGEPDGGAPTNIEAEYTLKISEELPETLEEFEVSPTSWSPHATTFDALRRFVDAKEASTPALRKLVVAVPAYMLDSDFPSALEYLARARNDLAESCMQQGVQLTLKPE